MGDEFLISAQRLRGSGSELTEVSGGFGATAGGLRSELAGSSAVWGADEPGSLFGSAYPQVAQLAGELLDAVVQGYEAISGNLQTMAGNVDAAEQSSSQASGQAGQNLAI